MVFFEMSKFVREGFCTLKSFKLKLVFGENTSEKIDLTYLLVRIEVDFAWYHSSKLWAGKQICLGFSGV